MSYINGIKTFTAGEDLAAHRRVKIDSGVPAANPAEVVYAGAGEDFIGVTEYAAEDGELIAVKMCTGPGTFEIECVVDSAIALGTVLYGAADGKVSDASSGTAQGICIEPGTIVDNAVIEVAAWNVKSTTAATTSIEDTGEFTEAATVEASLAEIYQHLLSAQATIPIPLGAITQEDGTALTKLNSTTSGFSQLTNKEIVIEIPVDATVEAFGFSVPVPQDLDDSKDITVHVLAGKAANLDALTLDCEVYPSAVGDVGNDDIQDTVAQTITEAISELIFICGADGVLAAPGTLSVVLTLGGTNDGDAVYIYGGWIEYTPKILTA
ncbi:MAG: hypothetical protein JXB42_01770 [Deltaproteobacteria bacterium]|nr:hypothetical protein [Deltaproteobacteria bacterium]